MAHYDTVYASTSGVREFGISGSAGFSMVFTDQTNIITYLPATGGEGPLTADVLNPATSMAGEFGGGVVTLGLNIDFADAGLLLGNLGIPFGDLRLHGLSGELSTLNDMSV